MDIIHCILGEDFVSYPVMTLCLGIGFILSLLARRKKFKRTIVIVPLVIYVISEIFSSVIFRYRMCSFVFIVFGTLALFFSLGSLLWMGLEAVTRHFQKKTKH